MSGPTVPDTHGNDDDAPSTAPAADTTTTTANGPVWTGRRWARPAAAGVGLLLVGGLGGFAVGHASGGGDDRPAPASFRSGQRGGPGPGGASGQQGGPGSGGSRMTPPQGGTQEAPSGQPGQSDGSTGSGDSTT